MENIEYKLNSEIVITVALSNISDLTTKIIFCKTKDDLMDVTNKLLSSYDCVQKHIMTLVEDNKMSALEAADLLMHLGDSVIATKRVLLNQLEIIAKREETDEEI